MEGLFNFFTWEVSSTQKVRVVKYYDNTFLTEKRHQQPQTSQNSPVAVPASKTANWTFVFACSTSLTTLKKLKNISAGHQPAYQISALSEDI